MISESFFTRKMIGEFLFVTSTYINFTRPIPCLMIRAVTQLSISIRISITTTMNIETSTITTNTIPLMTTKFPSTRVEIVTYG